MKMADSLETGIETELDGLDSSLTKRFINTGDPKAFEALFRRYAQPLINFAYSYLKNRESAENTVQDLFLKIWSKRKMVDPEQSIKSYLYTAIRNSCLNVIRHQKIVDSHRESSEIDESVAPSAEARLLESDRIGEIQQAIDALPDRCRQIFYLSKYDGLSYKEIASKLELSVKTVETQMGRAFKALRKRLSHLFMFIVGVLALISVWIVGKQ